MRADDHAVGRLSEQLRFHFLHLCNQSSHMHMGKLAAAAAAADLAREWASA